MVYRCPYKCGDPRYPPRQWKKEASFQQHLATCPQRPEAVAARAAARAMLEEAQASTRAAMLALAPHAVGDVVCCVLMYVTKPLRDASGVRVRYEEEREYVARQLEIAAVDWQPGRGYQFAGKWNTDVFGPGDVFPDIEVARAEAARRQQDYDESVAVARALR